MSEEHGAPYDRVPPMRLFDAAPVGIDWHDYLINSRIPGVLVDVGYVMRLPRRLATGQQYRCTRAGTTQALQIQDFRWPVVSGQKLSDGAAEWTAEAITAESLRSSISSEAWSAPSLTLSNAANYDLIYQVRVAGVASGQTYEVKHQITLANGEKKEGVVVLPIED